jgi:hypothetical protein
VVGKVLLLLDLLGGFIVVNAKEEEVTGSSGRGVGTTVQEDSLGSQGRFGGDRLIYRIGAPARLLARHLDYVELESQEELLGWIGTRYIS